MEGKHSSVLYLDLYFLLCRTGTTTDQKFYIGRANEVNNAHFALVGQADAERVSRKSCLKITVLIRCCCLLFLVSLKVGGVLLQYKPILVYRMKTTKAIFVLSTTPFFLFITLKCRSSIQL